MSVFLYLSSYPGTLIKEGIPDACDFKSRAHERIADLVDAIFYDLTVLKHDHVDNSLHFVLEEWRSKVTQSFTSRDSEEHSTQSVRFIILDCSSDKLYVDATIADERLLNLRLIVFLEIGLRLVLNQVRLHRNEVQNVVVVDKLVD